ncbi:hypothetical protein MKW94_023325 [Papaver nudicaule]|uniref:BED-type domain-containing protein n=1 Tax=Papaver nudicaule TaxID=74823 RepID=A0AA41RT59_PAPNU|nr:hypothetical protein [Papaver nudicaule]
MDTPSGQNISMTGSSDQDGSTVTEAPLWRHVVKLDKAPGGGGNRSFRCNFCNTVYNGSYSRVKAHLLKIKGQGIRICSKVDYESLKSLHKEHASSDQKKLVSTSPSSVYESPLPISSHSMQLKRRKMEDEEIQPAVFDSATRDELDKKAAKLFYSSALPFNLSRSPYWRDFITSVANSNCKGYSPPSYDQLRFNLLKDEKTRIERMLDKVKSSWDQTGVSILCDGWTDRNQRSLVNFMAVSLNGQFFLKAVDASGKEEDSKFLSQLLAEVINQVGPSRVVQIITDNASVCKAASLTLEATHPHVFWTPCVVHTLNLGLKNICSPEYSIENARRYEVLKWISDIDSDLKNIRDFIIGNEYSSSFYNKYGQLRLLKVPETRFATTIVLAKRVKEVRDALVKLVFDTDWEIYSTSDREKAQIFCTRIKDDSWWGRIDYLLEFTEPIVNMMGIADTNEAILHRVWEMWGLMLVQVQSVIFKNEKKDTLVDNSEFCNAVLSVLVERWDKNDTALLCLAYSLNPKYYSHTWLKGEWGTRQCLAPHQDQEISDKRILCLRRLYDNPYLLRQIQNEFGKFATGSAPFDQMEALQLRDDIDPISWWANFGSGTPLLQSLALRLLSQPASSSCCGRNWKTYSMIYNIKSKSPSARSEDVVYVHSNLRLMSRRTEDYSKGATKFWDIVGEDSDLEGQPELDLANLSLDDPVLEPMIFDEEEQDEGIEMLNPIGTSGSFIGGDEETD